MTLVIGTRFVTPPSEELSAKTLFTDKRIPLDAFNDTDHCVDQSALEVAQQYFTHLGVALGKAGHFYFVPDAAIKQSVAMCERMHKRAPQAWSETKTKIVAFARLVPTAAAPALEKSIR